MGETCSEGNKSFVLTPRVLGMWSF